METEVLNLELANEQPGKEKVRKKRRVRVKLDNGINKKQKKQKILTLLTIAFIGGVLLAAIVLYKIDQNSAQAQVEFTQPVGG